MDRITKCVGDFFIMMPNNELVGIEYRFAILCFCVSTWPLTPAAAVRYGYDYYPMIFRPSISYYLPSYLDLPHITEYT